MWQRHMNSSGVSQEDQTEAAWFSLTSIASADFSTPLEVLGVDQLRAKAVSTHLSYGWRSENILLSVVVRAYVYPRY